MDDPYFHDTWYDDGEYDELGGEEYWDDYEPSDDPPLSLRQRLAEWFSHTRAGRLIERFRHRNDEFPIPW